MPNLAGIARLWLPAVWMLGIFMLSSVPDHGVPRTSMESALQWVVPEVQNLLHIPLFGGLCMSWCWALKPFALDFKTIAGLSFVLTVVFGGFDEWHQLTVPGRFGSVTDVILNMLGAALAIYLVKRHNFVAMSEKHFQAPDK